MTGADSYSSGAPRSWHPLAHLYALATLDPIIEIVRAVAHDATRRPLRYRETSDDLTGPFEAFRFRVGTDPDWPSAAQRREVYTSLIGSKLYSACIGLRTAAVEFAEHSPGSADDLFRSVFRDAAARTQAYFRTLDGQALNTAARRTEAVFGSAIDLLRTPGVAHAFGLGTAPGGDWPLGGAEDGDAALLVETIGDALGLSSPQRFMDRHRFMLLRRTAVDGAQALSTLLDTDAEGDDGRNLNEVMQAAYRWEKALRDLLSGLDVRLAWRDPSFRDELSHPEKSMLPPHPSGEITLDGTDLDPRMATSVRMAFSTWTIRAICCCTGDLSCGTGSGILTLGERF